VLVSLVMATYGRSTELRPSLSSLIVQSDREFELIVVDQNPDDRVVLELGPLREAGLAVTRLRLDKPNLSAARNCGLAAVRGAIVAFPDDDCWYEPNVVEQVRRSFANRPDLDGIVARWVESEPAGQRLPERLTLQAWRKFRAGDATSFTLFLRIEQLRALDGFDVRLGTGQWYGSSEDTDLVLRMLAKGSCIEHVPSIRVHHADPVTPQLTQAQCRRNRSYGRGIGAIYAKHGLSAWVILRGLSGPIWRAVRSPRPGAALVLALNTIVGRAQGLFGWLLSERDDLPST
jgi:glycosyltransferase involved in cell wall biosynthesis